MFSVPMQGNEHHYYFAMVTFLLLFISQELTSHHKPYAVYTLHVQHRGHQEPTVPHRRLVMPLCTSSEKQCLCGGMSDCQFPLTCAESLAVECSCIHHGLSGSDQTQRRLEPLDQAISRSCLVPMWLQILSRGQGTPRCSSY